MRVILLCFFLLVTTVLLAQNVSINNTGTAANASAMLDVSSTTKGILIPRITLAQRTAMSPLPAVAQGLMVYQTDGVQGFYFNTSITSTPNWIYILGSNSGWGLTGNTGTTPATNFMGTTDAQPLLFKVNNQNAGYIDFDNTKANTGFGYQTLNSLTTGLGNTANGYGSLKVNSIGSNNTAIGGAVLYANTTGQNNTGNGVYTLFSNVAGNNGVAIGMSSQYYVNNQATSWDNTNTSIGYRSLYGSTTAANNTGRDNTAIGRDVLYNNTSGGANTATGFQALYNNTIGNNNTANGNKALFSNV